MRSYSNFLQFEDVLDYLPEDAPGLTQISKTLLSPKVEVVEDDCGTLLGRKIPLTFSSEGLIELATGEPLTKERIAYLLSSGKYNISIRDSGTCISEGGICKSCLQANVIHRYTSAEVGDIVDIGSEYAYFSQVLRGPGNAFSLDKDPDLYSRVIVFKNNLLVQPTDYAIVDRIIKFANSLTELETYMVFFIKRSSNLLLNYISRSYSGSLLGLYPLQNPYLSIKPATYRTIIPDTLLTLAKTEIEGYLNIPLPMINYIDKIADPLEKALYLLFLYAVYSGLND